MREDKTHSTGMTLISWCQIKRVGHSSPVMQLSCYVLLSCMKLKAKINNLGEIEDNIWNVSLICTIFGEVFSDHLCWKLYLCTNGIQVFSRWHTEMMINISILYGFHGAQKITSKITLSILWLKAPSSIIRTWRCRKDIFTKDHWVIYLFN